MKNEAEWPPAVTSFNVDPDDVELKKVKVFSTSVKVEEPLDRLAYRVSCWARLKRVFTWVLKYVKILQGRISAKHAPIKRMALRSAVNAIPELNVIELQAGESRILRLMQIRHFSKELSLLKDVSDSTATIVEKRKAVKKKIGCLYYLDPFIDSDGLLRVGGRLTRSELEFNSKHPVIIPNDGRISLMIVRWCHLQVAHSGRGSTLNEVRSQGYWVIRGNSVVRKIISACVPCRRFRGKFAGQKMSDLPFERTEDCPPFTYVGIDMFGPFYIKERRKELKRYCALFTCYSSRAIHIETTTSMETDSFIQALRRFVARRGNVRTIRTDNGGNFVGASRELNLEFKKMDHSKIKYFLANLGTDWLVWNTNPPTASHMGGVWERQIRSARNVYSSLLHTHGSSLDDDTCQESLRR